MIIFTPTNPAVRVALFVLPLILFAIIYFTTIKPSTDTANEAVRSATQSATQHINEARKHAPAGSAAAFDQAEKLTACVGAAGTDASKLQECQVKFGQ